MTRVFGEYKFTWSNKKRQLHIIEEMIDRVFVDAK